MKFKVSNKVYDIGKYTTVVFLPAVATLYFTLDQIWGLYESAKVVATITATNTFLGVVLLISSASYKDQNNTP